MTLLEDQQTERCGECGLSGYVRKTELGMLCGFCLNRWPYPAKEENPGRQSRCALCGRTQPSDPTSRYFQANPEGPYDFDWDGCSEGMGN